MVVDARLWNWGLLQLSQSPATPGGISSPSPPESLDSPRHAQVITIRAFSRFTNWFQT